MREFFLKPFTFEVWLAIVVNFIVVTLMTNILFRKNNSKNTKKVFNVSLRSYKICKEKSGIYFLKSGFFIAEAFIRFFYTSVLLSFLIVPSSSDIRTIPDLVKAINENNYRCASSIFTTHYFMDVMAKSEDPNIKILGPCISKYQGLRAIETALSDKTSNNKLSYIDSESYLEQFRRKYFVSEDGILLDLIAIGLKKDFCCKKKLNTMLNNILASGSLNTFAEYDYFKKKHLTDF